MPPGPWGRGVRGALRCRYEDAERRAAEVGSGSNKPKTFKDYQNCWPCRGGVIIATPPHWHALQFIEACRHKLPVIRRSRWPTTSARARHGERLEEGGNLAGGFQRRQSDAFRPRASTFSGSAGALQVDVNIHYAAGTPDPTPQAAPATLDWDQWCGPAPKLPYSPSGTAHGGWNRPPATAIWWIDLPDRRHAQAAGRAMPKAVTAMGGLYALKGKITTPDTLTAEFEFETCPVVWWHRLWGAVERDPEFSNGVTLFGEKETLFVSDNRWMILPKGRDAQRKVMDVKHTPEVGPRHMKEWLDAIGGGPKPACSPEDAFLSTATVQLGMIAYRAARTIQWDAQTGRIVNDPAVKMMIRPYRAPYRHPGV